MTFSSPSLRSLNLSKAHLTIPKRSQLMIFDEKNLQKSAQKKKTPPTGFPLDFPYDLRSQLQSLIFAAREPEKKVGKVGLDQVDRVWVAGKPIFC